MPSSSANNDNLGAANAHNTTAEPDYQAFYKSLNNAVNGTGTPLVIPIPPPNHQSSADEVEAAMAQVRQLTVDSEVSAREVDRHRGLQQLQGERARQGLRNLERRLRHALSDTELERRLAHRGTSEDLAAQIAAEMDRRQTDRRRREDRAQRREEEARQRVSSVGATTAGAAVAAEGNGGGGGAGGDAAADRAIGAAEIGRRRLLANGSNDAADAPGVNEGEAAPPARDGAAVAAMEAELVALRRENADGPSPAQRSAGAAHGGNPRAFRRER